MVRRTQALRSRMVGLAGALSLAAACAPADPAGRAGQPITGGTADSAHPAVVALALDDGTPWCSGSVIGEHTVLTAGHCVATVPLRNTLQVFFGDDFAGGGTFIAVSDSATDPDFDGATLANDLALLTLREAAVAAPLALDGRTVDAGFVDQTFTAVGYGVTDAGADDVGVRRAGTSRVTAVDATEITAAPDPEQACELDSGGPALFVDGADEVITGVVSRGDIDCIDHAIYARVDVAMADFIQAYLDATGPGSAHTGDACLYDGQCAEGPCLAAVDDDRLFFCAAPCTGADGDCPDGMDCVDDQCRYPAPSPGADGAPCSGDGECFGDICYDEAGSGDGLCTESCLGTMPDCPDGFECVDVEGIRFYCLAKATDGCCSAGGSPGPWPLLVLLWLRPRRRR